MSRDYRIRLDCGGKYLINEKRESLQECCEVVFNIFKEMNILDDLLNNIEICKTKYLKKDYFKIIKIWNFVPVINFEIKKLSTGDVSIDEVIRILKEQKENYERTRNKFRN
jgi:hypothetical protein